MHPQEARMDKRRAYIRTSPARIVEAEPQPLEEPLPERDPRPIGVFDTGVGGLTILSDLLRELPAERYVYYGDTGNCPYGVRPEEEIQRLTLNAAKFLIERGVKIIVVACNTASVSALKELRAAYDIPFVGVVPAVKPAAERTKAGIIGVAATEAAAQGPYLKQLIEDFAGDKRVLSIGCPQLVALVEAGTLDGPEAEEAIRGYVGPMLAEGIDELVLGCTHFPAMRAAFERVAGSGVEVIDSGAAVARQTRRVLEERCAVARPGMSPADEPRAPAPRDEFWTSGDAEVFARLASTILGNPVKARHAPGMRLTTTVEA